MWMFIYMQNKKNETICFASFDKNNVFHSITIKIADILCYGSIAICHRMSINTANGLSGITLVLKD